MVWVLKMLFKVIGYVLFYTFAIALGIVILPFYIIYLLCGGKPPEPKKKKEKPGKYWIELKKNQLKESSHIRNQMK